MKLIVKDCAPWDGDYEFDLFALTNRELHKVKLISEGVRPGELAEALDANDTGAFVGVASVVMEQHGLNVDPEDFWQAKVGSLTLQLGVSSDPPTTLEGDAVPSETTNGSGAPSKPAGENREPDPPVTGNRGSEVDVMSSPVTGLEAAVT